nr:histidine kinase [Pseudoclavibacter sp. 13-3]
MVGRVLHWFATHVQLVDTLLVAALSMVLVLPFALVGFGSPFDHTNWQNEPWTGFLFSVLVTAPLIWRRTHTLPAGIAMAAVCVLQVVLGVQVLPADALVLMMVYALAAYAPRWASIGGFWLAIAGAAALVVRYRAMPLSSASDPVDESGEITQPVLGMILAMALFFGFVAASVTAAWLLGAITRNRIAQQRDLREHAERLEIQQQQERDLAAADERARIAREMHDVVAHSLSVIITQADGARYASRNDPEIARRTLETIAETGRSSLHEMRRLLGVLHDDSSSGTRPMPTVADIPDLVDTVQLSGTRAKLTVSGDEARVSRLTAGAQLVAYRVVQEALTNTLKHAGTNPHATVALRWGPRTLQLQIDDDGRGALSSDDGEGNGLRGMRERLALYDGNVQAGPRAGGGFSVHATLPYENGAS